MKKILLTVFLLALPTGLMAQMTDAEIKAWNNSFGKPNQTPQETATGTVHSSVDGSPQEVTIDTILENVEAFTDPNPSPCGSDVIYYFNLQEEYNTPLKASLFEKTSEYKSYLGKLTQDCEAFLHKSYYIDDLCVLNNYDIKRQGFSCKISDNEDRTLPPYMNKGLVLKDLPIKLVYSYTNDDPTLLNYNGKRYAQYLFLPINEKKGLEVENVTNKKVYCICKKLVAGTHTYLVAGTWTSDTGGEKMEGFAPICSGTRVLIVDGQDGRILFEKDFNTATAKKKVSIH